MFETSGSWPSQLHSSLEMIAPVNIRQHEILPSSVSPCRVNHNSGFNEFGTPGWPEKGLAINGIGSIGNSMLYSPPELCIPHYSPPEQISPVPRVCEKPWTYKLPCPEERKFLIFDQSGNETRLMFSSLCPGLQSMPAMHTTCPFFPEMSFSKQFDANKLLPERQTRKAEQLCSMKPVIYEEFGENEILDEECREDTEEINALLYSDDDDASHDDDDYDDEDDDEVSSGHSPLIEDGACNKQEKQQESDFEDDVAISSISLKKRKTLDGEREQQNLAPAKIHSGDFISDLCEGTGPSIESKRPRKTKIYETLKVLESILPELKNKDPVTILDEAICYLKCLKYNAQSMSMEDSDSSGCYEPLN
ncbi:transcription factor bHLH143-like [Silene latifolia]|uniref:transcription factor bHLH143-like n=1 Tax=Silene latifolia TaxID=37657 RepID=UPI003D76B44B